MPVSQPAVSTGEGSDALAINPAVTREPGNIVENVEREMYELPVKSTVKTGHEVDQSYSQRPNSSVAVSPYPLPVSVRSSETQEDSQAD